MPFSTCLWDGANPDIVWIMDCVDLKMAGITTRPKIVICQTPNPPTWLTKISSKLWTRFGIFDQIINSGFFDQFIESFLFCFVAQVKISLMLDTIKRSSFPDIWVTMTVREKIVTKRKSQQIIKWSTFSTLFKFTISMFWIVLNDLIALNSFELITSTYHIHGCLKYLKLFLSRIFWMKEKR